MLDLSSFTPHGFCLAWEPGLVWLQAGSDLAIALAYFTIPFALLRFTRLRRDLAFPWVFRLFAAFILACGTTHVLGVVTLWWPVYWTEAMVKFLTAIVSVATAAMLWPLLPKALSLPSQQQLRELNARLSSEIADRRAAEARALESERRLKSIYTRTPAPLCATDPAGHILEVSDQWLELVGLPRGAVVGKPLNSFHTPASRDELTGSWARVQEGTAMRDVEQTLQHGDGSERLVLTSAALEPDGSAVLAMTDITERRAVEHALQASEAHLRQAQKMEAVGHLTGGIAHDFNNMLTAIMVVMELLQKRLPADDRSRQLVVSVLDVSRRAARLTAQLLAFSRRQRLVPEALAPLEVALGMRELLTRSIGEQIVLTIASTPQGEASGAGGTPAWLAVADRNQVEAALLNMVLNAKGAGATSIGITMEALPADALHRSAAAVGELEEEPLLTRDYVAITLSDNGSGMTDDTRRRAFEPFFTTKPVGQGTGLGLSQAYGFARQSGGTIRIDTVPGAGTRMTLILPRAPQAVLEEPTLGAPAATPARRGNGKRLLVVEDEDTLREVLVAALSDQDYRVIAARNGDEALAIVEGSAAIDLVFTDIVMPGSRNGVEMALELRERIPGLPVLFATGYSDRRVLDRWTDGTPQVIAKPYSIDALLVALADQAAAKGSALVADHPGV